MTYQVLDGCRSILNFERGTTSWPLDSYTSRGGYETARSVLKGGKYTPQALLEQVKASGLGPLLMVVLGGGVVAGTMGIAFFYNAISAGNLSVVLPIAFCLTPVLGVVIGLLFLGERLAPLQGIGILLTVAGATMAVYYKAS